MIENRSVYDILNQICKDTDLYPYTKQHKSKKNYTGTFYAIHFRWPDLNEIIAAASEAEMALQTPTYNGEKRHGTGKSLLNNMSSTILSLETLWIMDTKASIQD